MCGRTRLNSGSRNYGEKAVTGTKLEPPLFRCFHRVAWGGRGVREMGPGGDCHPLEEIQVRSRRREGLWVLGYMGGDRDSRPNCKLPIGCPKTEKEVINDLEYPSPGKFSCFGRTNPSAKKSQISLCLCLYHSVIVNPVKRGSGGRWSRISQCHSTLGPSGEKTRDW